MDVALGNQVILAGTTLAASFGGFLFAGINERRRDQRQATQDRARVDREQVLASDERSSRFQLDTLLDLQDALQVKARVTGRSMHFDHMQARNSEHPPLPETFSEEMQANGVAVNRLASRVLSDDLRNAVSKFSSACASQVFLSTVFEGLRDERLEDAAFRNMSKFSDQVNEVMELVGAAIRLELKR